MEEQEPFLTLPSPTKLSKNVTQQQSGRITGTLIVLFLSFISVIPQTIVAINTRSMALLADSLCMWSDSASYLACVAVFYLLKQQRHRAKYGTLFDFIGALIGLILLVASAAYITSESMEILMKLGTKTKEVDGKWGVVFAIVGAVVDALSMYALIYYADPEFVTKKGSEDVMGTISFLSVVVHLAADIVRLFGLLISGLLSEADPSNSEAIDASVSLVMCGVMFLMSVFLFYKVYKLGTNIGKNELMVDGCGDGGGGEGGGEGGGGG